MSLRRARAAGLACALSAALAAPPTGAAADAAEPATVRVSLDRAGVATRIGESFRFAATVTNMGAASTPGLVAHLDVVSLDPEVVVDPEDWSSERTRYLAPLPPGRRARIAWDVKAVDGGRFTAYVAVLGPHGLAAGPGLDVRVARHRTLDPGGVVPLAVGVPGLLGVLLLGLRRRRRA
ncbi:MAG: hypothetical protein QOH43_1419 [Solirubrobacteraceae bacterium]|jgi:hypothetical protein|nr:hypothetical protein [Solirubrobacteraceae bacterium]